MKVEHLSASRIVMMERCGEQARRRYGENEILPPGIAMLRGKNAHRVAEHHLRHKMETGELWPMERVRDETATYLRQQLDAAHVIDGDYAELGEKQARALLQAEVLDLNVEHAEEFAPVIAPTAMEEHFELRPSESLPVPFVGYIDLIDGGVRIRDLKTKQKAPSKGDADKSTQLTAYALGFAARYQRFAEELALDFLIRSPKTGAVKSDTQTTTRTREDMASFIARARRTLEAFEKEVFLPAREDSWQCSERWCGYWSTCPYVRGRKRPAT